MKHDLPSLGAGEHCQKETCDGCGYYKLQNRMSEWVEITIRKVGEEGG